MWRGPALAGLTLMAMPLGGVVLASSSAVAQPLVGKGYTVTYALSRGTTTCTARYKDSENWYPAASVTAGLTR